MKRIILLCSLALLALTSSAQTTGTFNKVNARDTLNVSGNSVAEIVKSIISAARNNELPTAKAVYDYGQSIRDARWSSVKLAMPFYSNNPNTAFEALRTYYSARVGEIVVDTSITISTNTTVSASVRFVGGGNINVTTGNTVTFGSTIRAEPKHFVFTGAGTYAFNSKSVEVLYPYWFGALGNNSADDYDEIQKTVDAAIASQIHTVRFLSGIHLVSKGILVRNGSSTVTVTIMGNQNYDSTPGTAIYSTDSTNFVIGVQGARAVILRNLYLAGYNRTYNPGIAQIITNTVDNWRDQYGRDNRYSPFSAIVIDPFKTTAPTGGGYPGFSSQYSNSHSLSSNILIENVIIRYFPVGIMVSPSGSGGNGSEITIKSSTVNRCRIGVASGGSQNRSINIADTYITGVAACLDGLSFGEQAGIIPSVIGGQLGTCKDILRFSSATADGKFVNTYSESVYRIGKWTGNFGSTLSFLNCEIRFTTSTETLLPDAASVLDAPNNKVVFVGGSLIYTTYRPVEMNVQNLNFTGVRFFRPIINNPSGNSLESRIVYESCQIDGYSNQYFQSKVERTVNGIDLNRAYNSYQVPGQRIAYYEAGTNFRNTVVCENTNDAEDHKIQMEQAVYVTVDTVARTAKFLTSAGMTVRYRIGDILFSNTNTSTATPNGTSKACTWGIVTNLSGDTVICKHIPSGISSGTYNVYLWREAVFIGTYIGNITSGSNKVVITSKNTGNPTLATAWAVGMRVYAKTNQAYNSGLYTGLYVASVTNDTLFLSGNVGSTVSGLEIFNADYRCTYISEDNTFQTSLSSNRTVGYQTGDEILFRSHAYRAQAIVTSGGFTPSLKFIFKPLSGLAASKPTPTADDAGVTYFSTDTDALEIWDGTAWNAQDASAVNEAWTIDGDDADTELITTQTVKFAGAGSNTTDYDAATNTLTITGASGGTNYQTWRDDGTPATARPNANFVSTSTVAATLTDDAGNTETEVTMNVPTGGITTTQILDNTVANADFRQSAALSVVGNATNATANVADISAASDFQVLRRSGTALAFGSVNLASSNAVTGILSGTNGGTGVSTFDAANRVPYALSTTTLQTNSAFTFHGTYLNVPEIRFNGSAFSKISRDVGDGSVYFGYNINSPSGGVYEHAATGQIFGIATNGRIRFYANTSQTAATAASEKMSLLSSGRLGIGTTAPANLLDVEGSAAIGATYSGTTAAPTNGLIVEGDVGVGINSPGAKMHLKTLVGASTPIMRLDNTAGDVDIFVTNATPEGAITGSPGDISLRTDSGNGKIYVKGSGTGNTGWLDVSAGGGATDHGALTGLGDDDHTQYLLLAGRSGGQIATGGTGSGDDLVLRSTTNATKGDVFINDQGGNTILGGGELSNELRFMEPAGSGANYTGFKSGAMGADQMYTLPIDAPADGEVLGWHTGGGLSWDAVDTDPTNDATNDLTYVTMSNTSALSNERALSSGINNVRVDFGPNSSVNLDVLGGVSNVSQFTSDQDNYTNSDWSSRTTHTVSSDGEMRAMTGFAALAEGTVRRIINTGTFPMYSPAEHPDSDAANRVFGTGDQIIAPNGGVLEITYIGSRWHVTGNSFSEANLGFKYKGQFYNQMPGSTNQSDHPFLGLTSAGTGAGNQSNPPDDSPDLPQAWGLLTGTTATGSQTVYFPKNNNAFAAFGSGHLAAFGQIYVPTLSTSGQRYTAQISLTPSANGSTLAVNSSVGIRYSDNVNGGEWEVFTRNSGGTETTGDSNIAVAANTVYTCAIYVDKACTEARFFITDGTNNYVTRIAATMPATTALAGVRIIGIASVGTTSKQVAACNIGGYFIQP